MFTTRSVKDSICLVAILFVFLSVYPVDVESLDHWGGFVATYKPDLNPAISSTVEPRLERRVDFRRFLEQFGYWNRTQTDSLDNKSDFDDYFKEIYKQFQKNMQMEVSEVLDDETRLKMVQPRCGHPDIVSPHNNRDERIWNQNVLTYYLENYPTSLRMKRTSDIEQVFDEAFREWESATNLSFYPHNSKDWGSDITIRFKKETDEDCSKNVEPSSKCLGIEITGHTYVRKYRGVGKDERVGTIEFSDDVVWTLETLLPAALHQIGHVLGFSHRDDSESIMFPLKSDKKRGLSDSDKEIVGAIYRLPESSTIPNGFYVLPNRKVRNNQITRMIVKGAVTIGLCVQFASSNEIEFVVWNKCNNSCSIQQVSRESNSLLMANERGLPPIARITFEESDADVTESLSVVKLWEGRKKCDLILLLQNHPPLRRDLYFCKQFVVDNCSLMLFNKLLDKTRERKID